MRLRRKLTSVAVLAVALGGCGVPSEGDGDPGPGALSGRDGSPAATAAGRDDESSGDPAGVASPDAAPGATAGRTLSVATVAELEAALVGAGPGTVIEIADGTYQRDGGDRFTAAADGTADAPITLRGTTAAVLTSDGIRGDYGLHVTGDHYRLDGFAVREATKGIVLDGSVGTIIDGVDVGHVGEEGVHFRACSSGGVLRDSTIHDTGLQKPRFGEGVYVGSANSNWDKYGCADGRDGTQDTLIEGNTFTRIAAEGADLKEGTDSGILRDNVFVDAGYSGENSADSAIDVKGNGWSIIGNTIREPSGAALDAIQIHHVYDGYGRGNTIDSNVVEGDWPGFGVGAYPLGDNLVTCSNAAPGARLGLVGDGSRPATCS